MDSMLPPGNCACMCVRETGWCVPMTEKRCQWYPGEGRGWFVNDLQPLTPVYSSYVACVCVASSTCSYSRGSDPCNPFVTFLHLAITTHLLNAACETGHHANADLTELCTSCIKLTLVALKSFGLIIWNVSSHPRSWMSQSETFKGSVSFGTHNGKSKFIDKCQSWATAPGHIGNVKVIHFFWHLPSKMLQISIVISSSEVCMRLQTWFTWRMVCVCLCVYYGIKWLTFKWVQLLIL